MVISPAEVLHTKRLNFPIVAFLLGTPVLAVVVLCLYIAHQKFVWTDLIPFFFMLYATGLAITSGYHRYFAHKTFECHPVVQFLFLAFGAATFQNSVLNWASDHRYHHIYADREGDPYSVFRGFWWAHMGWMFFFYPSNRAYKNAADLKASRVLMWQERYYLPLAITTGFFVPMAIGALFGRPWGGLIYGGLVRMVVGHQITFMINSVAHSFGRKTYDPKSTASDSPWLAAVTFGEGYHSFHHAFAGDYRIGHRWYDIDCGKWLILGLHRVGLASKLRKTYRPRSASLATEGLQKTAV